MGKALLKESPVYVTAPVQPVAADAMDAMDAINDAIVIYTGFGKSPFPRARSNDLVTRFGAAEGAEFKARILALMEELGQPILDEKRSKKSVTERAIEQLRPKHPELDETSLKALALTFSFGLR